MAGCDAVDDVGRGGGRRQGRPRPQQPATRQGVNDGERGVPAGDDAAADFVHHMNGISKMALRGQIFQQWTPGSGGERQRHELETAFVVPSAQPPDGLAADAAVIVVDDGE